MFEIIPSILCQNYEEIKNKISLVRGIVPVVQIDICDGVFVSSKTWPFFASPSLKTADEQSKATQGTALFNNNLDEHFFRIVNEEEGMPFWQDIDFELDLMVADAVQNFDIYTKLSPKRIIFHIEAVGDLAEFKDFLEGMDVYIRDAIEIGLALNPKTPNEKIFPLVNYIDFVQFMGNDKIGFSGIGMDEKIIEKIKNLREKYSDLPIAVDIGVNEKTAKVLAEAGATKLVVGSAIFKSEDIRETINELENVI